MSFVALEDNDISHGLVAHTGELMKQYSDKGTVARSADLDHIVAVGHGLRAEVADDLSEVFAGRTEDAPYVLTIGWRYFDGSGVDATIRWDIYRCCVQSEQGFADANTSISADAVPHLQMFAIFIFFLC